MPLHPLFVHFPIVIAFLGPVAVLGALYFAKESGENSKIWIGVMALYLLLSLTAFGAMNLGEEDEERVERVVSERIIEAHAEKGELFAWSSLAPLIFAGLLIYRRDKYFKGLLLASSVGLMALVIPVGHSGAELVYRHHAGVAYWGAGEMQQPGDHKGSYTDDDD